jgi:formiminotetrahydrofolate cyclodeaminase
VPDLTLNGVSERVTGLEKLLNNCMDNINSQITDVKAAIQDIKDNDIEHIRQDIEELKKFMWKIMGGIGVVLFLSEIILKFVKIK